MKVLRQLLTAGFIDQVAVRKDRIEQIAGGAQYSSSKGVAYRALGVPEDVFIHPSSVLANSPPPEYLVFNEVVRTSRVWIKGESGSSVALVDINRGSRPDRRKSLLAIFPWEGLSVYVLETDEKQCWHHDGYSSVWSRWMGAPCYQGREAIGLGIH